MDPNQRIKDLLEKTLSRYSSLINLFHEKPLLIFWEVTKACPLTCIHCRAESILEPLPGELSTEEGYRLIDDVLGFGKPYPILVFTGGDPLMRRDIYDLLRYAKSRDLRIGVALTVSERLDNEKLYTLRRIGVDAVSISLDGAFPETHDYIRRSRGNYYRTIEVIKKVIELGFSYEVNTLIWKRSLIEIPELARLLRSIGANTLEAFFYVPVGRGLSYFPELELSPEEYEVAINILLDLFLYGFTIRFVEAPFYRRVLIERLAGSEYRHPLYLKLRERLRELLGEPPEKDLSKYSFTPTRDGQGIIFVAYNGDIYPSGYLPYKLGNVKEDNIVDIYRNHPILKAIRDSEFRGKCGECIFKRICGGSRSRAYAYYKDPLGEDPACIITHRKVL
jgi:radical SAM protein